MFRVDRPLNPSYWRFTMRAFHREQSRSEIWPAPRVCSIGFVLYGRMREPVVDLQAYAAARARIFGTPGEWTDECTRFCVLVWSGLGVNRSLLDSWSPWGFSSPYATRLVSPIT
jgi:hypothetical protein